MSQKNREFKQSANITRRKHREKTKKFMGGLPSIRRSSAYEFFRVVIPKLQELNSRSV